MGGHRPIVWGFELSDEKKHHGLKWPPVDDFKRNNQPKTSGPATEGSMEGRFDEREMWGKRNSIVLGTLDIE